MRSPGFGKQASKVLRESRERARQHEKYSQPIELDLISVTSMLMSAAEYLGVDYAKNLITPRDVLDAELPPLPLPRESPWFDGRMAACHLVNDWARVHQFIRPHWDRFCDSIENQGLHT